jgi:phospholipid N-methyltransferase
MLLHFLTQTLRHNRTIGAVLPSGKPLSRALAKAAFSQRKGPMRILEVGAGTGPVTRELVQRLHAGDHLDVVELNDVFCKVLREQFPNIPVHEISILDYEVSERYDVIVSCLPLANFSSEMVEAIYQQFFKLLKPDGGFVMFHYIGLREALAAIGTSEYRKNVSVILKMERKLKSLVAAEVRVPFNVPPAIVTVRRRPEVVERLLPQGD